MGSKQEKVVSEFLSRQNKIFAAKKKKDNRATSSGWIINVLPEVIAENIDSLKYIDKGPN